MQRGAAAMADPVSRSRPAPSLAIRISDWPDRFLGLLVDEQQRRGCSIWLPQRACWMPSARRAGALAYVTHVASRRAIDGPRDCNITVTFNRIIDNRVAADCAPRSQLPTRTVRRVSSIRRANGILRVQVCKLCRALQGSQGGAAQRAQRCGERRQRRRTTTRRLSASGAVNGGTIATR